VKVLLLVCTVIIIGIVIIPQTFAEHTDDSEQSSLPKVLDENYVVEQFMAEGIPNSPTTMTFLGDDILVLQRYDGIVRLVKNGILQPLHVLDVSVAKDGERENPAFKEAVKVMLTPMISSLSILNYVDMDSEESVLVYGISLIILNLGMYFVAPVIVIAGIRNRF